VTFIHRGSFLRPWLGCYAAPSVKASPVVVIVYHCTVNIGVMDNRSVYTHNRCVITEPVAVPPAAAIAIAAIAVAIVDAAVKSYMGTPIPRMKSVKPVVITPVGRGPV